MELHQDARASDSPSTREKSLEIHALLGESGAGKSTLVKIVYGALQPTAGRLRWRGELSEAYPADAIDRERIGLPMAGAHETGAAAGEGAAA